MKTNSVFINEFEDFLAFESSMDTMSKKLDDDIRKYELTKSRRGLELYFESYNTEEYRLMCEEEEKNIFQKIGEYVKQLIDKFINFITSLFKKDINNEVDELERDKKIVEKMVAENPTIGKEIVAGIKNERFTYGDVAKYNKDMYGLLELILTAKVDDMQIQKKIDDIDAQYAVSESPLLKGIATVQTVAAITTTLVGTAIALWKGGALISKCKSNFQSSGSIFHESSNVLFEQKTNKDGENNSSLAVIFKNVLNKWIKWNTSKLAQVKQDIKKVGNALKNIIKSNKNDTQSSGIKLVDASKHGGSMNYFKKYASEHLK